ncbi:MAG: VWA domain-containing protein [Candidatus Berkiellales bacterium]
MAKSGAPKIILPQSALFATILESQGCDDPSQAVQRKDGRIHFTSRNLLAKNLVKKSLSSPLETRQSVNYSLKEIGGHPEAMVTQDFTGMKFDDVTALSSLPRIFSKDLLSIIGLNEDNLKRDDPKDKVLRIVQPRAAESTLRDQKDLLALAMTRAGIHGMQSAFVHGDELVGVPEITEAAQPVVSVPRNILEILLLPDNKVGFYIYYGALMTKVLFPQAPKVIEETRSDGLFELSYDEEELNHYLIHVFKEGFILRIDGENAQPICLPKFNLATRKILTLLLLDRSANMQASFKELIQQLEQFIDHHLEKSLKGDLFVLMPFEYTAYPIEFKLTGNKIHDKKRIMEELKALRTHGATWLYGATEKAFEELSKYKGYHKVIVSLTTSKNTVSLTERTEAAEKEYGKNRAAEIKKRLDYCSDDEKPMVFTFTVDNESQDDFHMELSQQIGSAHAKLKSSADFEAVYSHVEKLRRPQAVVKLLQELRQESIFLYEGTLAMSQFLIRPGLDFTYDGRSFRYNYCKPGLLAHSKEFAVPMMSPSFTPSLNKVKEQEKAEAEAKQEEIAREDVALSAELDRVHLGPT